MGHLVGSKTEIYRALAERLHRNPVGNPVNKDFLEILYRLYAEDEALAGSNLPLNPVTLEQAADITGFEPIKLKKMLDSMIKKGLMLEIKRQGESYYMLALMIVGFFELLFMRVREDIDLKELAVLFEKYFQNFEVGVELFKGETKFMHALLYEKYIPALIDTEVLDYEKATQVVKQAGRGAVGLCACRHKAIHLDQPCKINAPLDVCISLGEMADFVIKNHDAKPASVDDMLIVLERSEKMGLVHLCDNVINDPAYICNCCGCCCGMLHVIKEYGINTVHPSNFYAVVNEDLCNGCAVCSERCQVSAISMDETENGEEVAKIDLQRCLGCGICAEHCGVDAIHMVSREEKYIPALNKNELYSKLARERDKVFDLKPEIIRLI